MFRAGAAVFDALRLVPGLVAVLSVQAAGGSCRGAGVAVVYPAGCRGDMMEGAMLAGCAVCVAVLCGCAASGWGAVHGVCCGTPHRHRARLCLQGTARRGGGRARGRVL